MQVLEKIRIVLRRITSKLPERGRPGPPGDPEDPYALVGAPRKPRTPLRSATIALELPKE